MKHYKSVEFLSNFRLSSPWRNVKPLYWRFSGDGSGPSQRSIWSVFSLERLPNTHEVETCEIDERKKT